MFLLEDHKALNRKREKDKRFFKTWLMRKYKWK